MRLGVVQSLAAKDSSRSQGYVIGWSAWCSTVLWRLWVPSKLNVESGLTPVKWWSAWSMLGSVAGLSNVSSLLMCSPTMSTPPSMSTKWIKLWFWAFLYTELLLFCYWSASRVVGEWLCGSLGSCKGLQRETEGERELWGEAADACEVTGRRCTMLHVDFPTNQYFWLQSTCRSQQNFGSVQQLDKNSVFQTLSQAISFIIQDIKYCTGWKY
jgi:hypothetical protein